jgi:hypothetical protein
MPTRDRQAEEIDGPFAARGPARGLRQARALVGVGERVNKNRFPLGRKTLYGAARLGLAQSNIIF